MLDLQLSKTSLTCNHLGAMAQQYLLSCSCGNEIPVEVSQAGETVTCACGASVTVPSMREVRALPTVGGAPPEPVRKTRSWHPLQGVLFGIGAFLLLLFGWFASGTQVFRQKLDRREPPELRAQLESHVAELEQADIDQIYEGWKINKALPLRNERPFQFVVFRQWYQELGWMMVLYLAGMAVGVAFVVASLIIHPSQDEPPPPSP